MNFKTFSNQRRVGGYVCGFPCRKPQSGRTGSEPKLQPKEVKDRAPTKPESKVNANITGPINTGSGGAPASSPRGDTPAGMRPSLKDHQSKPCKALRAIDPPSTLHGQRKAPRVKANRSTTCSNRGKPGTLSLRRVLSRYFQYLHRARTHLSLDKDCPPPRRIQLPSAARSSRSLRWAVCIIATNVAPHDLSGPPTDPPASA
jgi:hypothetical protein